MAEYGVRPGDPRQVGAGQTGETMSTSGWKTRETLLYEALKALVDAVDDSLSRGAILTDEPLRLELAEARRIIDG